MQSYSWLDNTNISSGLKKFLNMLLTSKHVLLENNSGWESMNSDKNRPGFHIEHLHNQTNTIFKL